MREEILNIQKDNFIQSLDFIESFIDELINQCNKEEYDINYDKKICIHKTCIIDKNCRIEGPCFIMENSSIGYTTLLRENVIIGPNTKIGHACEIKNSIIGSYNQIPHYNYVGDSILKDYVHLGAGVITTNVRLDKKPIGGRNKVGAFIGNHSEIGSNSVLCPGSIVDDNENIPPLTTYKHH